MPLLTYICPCLNNLNGLKLTVESFLSLDAKDFVLFIVDGCSSDGSVEYLSNVCTHHSKVRFLSEKDSSLYEAINRGIRLIHSGYIGIVGSGDIFIADSFTQSFFSFLEDSLSIDTYPIIAGSVSRSLTSFSNYNIPSLKTAPFLTALNMNICHPALLLHRDHYDFLGLYSTRFNITADHHFVIRLVYSELFSSIVFLSNPFIHMSEGGLSQRLSKKVQLYSETIQIYCDLFPIRWPVFSLIFLSRNIASIIVKQIRRLRQP